MDDVDQVGNTADIEEAQQQVSSDVAAGEAEQLASAEGEETGDDSQAGMENPGAVSYTHLDVYKRQVFTSSTVFSSSPFFKTTSSSG